MGKRDKKNAQAASERRNVASASALGTQVHLPKKRPVLLAISALLFTLWFIFLLVTAVFG